MGGRERRERDILWQFSDYVVSSTSKCFDYRSLSTICWKIVSCISCVLLMIKGSGGGGRKMRRGKGQPDQKLCDVIGSYKVKQNKNQRNGSTLYDLNQNINLKSYNIIFLITKEYLSLTRLSNLNCSNLHQNLAKWHDYKLKTVDQCRGP